MGLNVRSYPRDEILSLGTKANLGLAASATPNDAFQKLFTGVSGASAGADKALARDLQIMMNQALGSSNIDAWADLLADNSRLNAGATTGAISDGKATCITNYGQNVGTEYNRFLGYQTGQMMKAGQTFKAAATGELKSIKVYLYKNGSPSDSITMSIYAANMTTLLKDSSNSIVGSTLASTGSGTPTECVFNFSGLQLTKGTTYLLCITRTGALSTTNFYNIVWDGGAGTYTDGYSYNYENSTWNMYSGDIKFTVTQEPASTAYVWNQVVSSSNLSYVVVSAIQTLGTGSVTYYVSQDGTNWIQILALNTAQAVNFTGPNVYLKAVITGNAQIDAVAWGGY